MRNIRLAYAEQSPSVLAFSVLSVNTQKQTKKQTKNSPGASKTDRTCCCDGHFLSVYLTTNKTHLRNPAALSRGKYSDIPGISLDRQEKKQKLMPCVKEREYARPMQEARWRSKGKVAGQGVGLKEAKRIKNPRQIFCSRRQLLCNHC